MIKAALRQLPDQRGTKKDITDKVGQLFFPTQLHDAQWRKSVSQTLSSNKSQFIRKLKGTFGVQPVPPE